MSGSDHFYRTRDRSKVRMYMNECTHRLSGLIDMRMVNLIIQMLHMVGKVDQPVTDQDGVHYPHDGLLHCQHHT